MPDSDPTPGCYEYRTTTGPRKAWDGEPDLTAEGWEPDPDRRYWRRLLPKTLACPYCGAMCAPGEHHRCPNRGNVIVPSAPPAPAPASELDTMERLARAEMQEQSELGEGWITANELIADGYVESFAEFVAFCTPERVAQLVAAAREAEAFARTVATNYDHDADAHRYGTGCRCCLAEAFLAARASRPTEETDG